MIKLVIEKKKSNVFFPLKTLGFKNNFFCVCDAGYQRKFSIFGFKIEKRREKPMLVE